MAASVPRANETTAAGAGPAASDLGVRERWYAWRDRLLASHRFQRAAARFWPTRWIARRRARATFDLVAGFVYSQVLLACVRLGVLARLAEAAQTAPALAARVGLDVEATDRLLAAAAALRLVEARGGGRWGLGALGAPIVGNVGLLAMVEHHALLYADLADPVALLRAPGRHRLAAYWPYAAAADPRRLDEAQTADYSALMSASNGLVADAVLDAVPLARCRCLLDIGGGDGAFAVAAAARAPALRVVVFDLPAVAKIAEQRLRAAGLAARARAIGGDFLVDALPRGADVATLNRVLHDHDDDGVRAVLAAAFAALEPGGSLVVAEPMAATPGAERAGDAYFGMYLLAMGRGRPRTLDRLLGWLEGAGFRSARALATPLPLLARVVVATKPLQVNPDERIVRLD